MCMYHYPTLSTKIVFQVDLSIKTKVLNAGRICSILILSQNGKDSKCEIKKHKGRNKDGIWPVNWKST